MASTAPKGGTEARHQASRLKAGSLVLRAEVGREDGDVPR